MIEPMVYGGGWGAGKTDARNRLSPGRYWGLRQRGHEMQVCQGNRIEARYPLDHERKAVMHCRVKMGQTIFPEHPR